jgi:hypothetical protein
VQANDDVVIARHIGAVFFGAARNSAKNPAARVHDVAVNVVPLAETPREHTLAACNVGRGPGRGNRAAMKPAVTANRCSSP